MLPKFADPCHPNPCNNNGVCSILVPGTYTCDCSSTGYTGNHCENGNELLTIYNLDNFTNHILTLSNLLK